MANSLRAKLKKLAHDGKINRKELDELLKKLDGHDRELQSNQCYLDSPCEYQNKDVEVKEVCEWKEYVPMDKAFHRYDLGCRVHSFKFTSNTDYNYCPYCGRKIKVVK